jgi:uncharacterized protein (DUF427 family)
MTAATSLADLENRRPVPSIGVLFQLCDWQVRATIRHLTIVDSRSPVLVWESTNARPFYAFPHDEVRTDLLRLCRGVPPRHRSGAAQWFDLNLADDRIPRAAWAYSVPELSSYIAFDLANPTVREAIHWLDARPSADWPGDVTPRINEERRHA